MRGALRNKPVIVLVLLIAGHGLLDASLLHRRFKDIGGPVNP
jgi:hypothetical protein